MVNDFKNEVLFETRIPYEQMVMDGYTDIEMNLSLNPGGQSYYLSVYLEGDAEGRMPVLKACGTQQHIPENMVLMQGDELYETQLLTRYSYSDALIGDKCLRAVLLCGFTALGNRFRIASKLQAEEGDWDSPVYYGALYVG